MECLLTPSLHGLTMLLSNEAVLVYVLRSGCSGRLTKGRIERQGSRLNVYAPHPSTNNVYLSENLRSWCILGADGMPWDDWFAILPEDRPRLLPVKEPN
jgi:hypothetical protein